MLDGLDLPNMVGAEIGPLHNPLVSRSEGHIVYVDHKSAEELRVSYASDPNVNVKNIQVDAIWGSHTLREAIDMYFQKSGRNVQSLDYVLASHVIEHVPDLITWLQEIRSVLSSTGQVRLAVPDRRYTFDYLRRTTNIEDVLVAYVHRARMPNTHCILDFCLNFVTVDTAAAWQGPLDVAQLEKYHTFEGAVDAARDAYVNGAYVDVHCWVFTLQSFASLFIALAKANLIEFSCEEFFEPERLSNEFIVNLRANSDQAAVVASWERMAETIKAREQRAAELVAQRQLEDEQARLRAAQETAAAQQAAAAQAAADEAAAAEAARQAVEAARLASRPRVTGIRSAIKALAHVIKR